MRTGRPTKPLEITDEDREKLSMIARRPNLGGHPNPANGGHLKGSSALLVDCHLISA
jgi:hypothetical protein